MVHFLVTLSEDANRVPNVVKAKHGLRTKSQAIEPVTRACAEELLEPELRPEYVEKITGIERERSIRVRSFSERYGLQRGHVRPRGEGGRRPDGPSPPLTY